MLLTQYDEQAHIEYEKEISYEEGREEGKIIGAIKTYQKMHVEREQVILALVEDFSISAEDAEKYMERYGAL